MNILDEAVSFCMNEGPDSTRNVFMLTSVPVTTEDAALTTLSVILIDAVLILPPAFKDNTSVVFAPTR